MLDKPCLSIWILLCLSSAAQADYVLLKNGQRLRGEVIKEDATEVILLMPSVRTRLARDRISQIIKEDNSRYYQSEGRAFLERGMYEDVVRFLERGQRQYRDNEELKRLSEAAGHMIEARKLAAVLKFDAAIGQTKLALGKRRTSKRLARQLSTYQKTLAFWQAHGSLPGRWIQLKRRGVRIAHHQPLLAEKLMPKLLTSLRDQLKTFRATYRHKLPKQAVFVLMVYRNREEFLKRMPDSKKYPQGLLPMTDQARLVTDTRGATYQQVADRWVDELTRRYTLIQLYQLLPLWALEGIAAGGLEKKLEGMVRAAVVQDQESKLLMSSGALMAQRHYGQLARTEDRVRFARQSKMLVHFFVRHRRGRYTLFSSFKKARLALMNDIRLILNGKKKYKGSLRFENMYPAYVPKQLIKQFKYKNAKALDGSFAKFVQTGVLQK